MKKIPLLIAGSVALAILLLISTAACKPSEPPQSEAKMGDPAVAGPLTFTVLETKWQSQLEGFPTPRMPERNFLLIRVSVTNSGGADTNIPFLQLQNSSNDMFNELENGSGVDGWLGMLRTIRPAQTEEGWILFDVPTNSYRLRVTDGNVENERVTYVSIPLTMQTDL
jgi:hypothetical protein